MSSEHTTVRNIEILAFFLFTKKGTITATEMSTNAPYTICLSSSDAKHDAENGMFTWSIKSENRKHHVSKVYLASIELPMSQDTIEPAWNRVYFTERLVLGSERRTLRVRETSQQPASVFETTATLPMHLNAIVRMNLETRSVGTNVSTYLMFETEHVHGLTHAAFKWARDVQHRSQNHCDVDG